MRLVRYIWKCQGGASRFQGGAKAPSRPPLKETLHVHVNNLITLHPHQPQHTLDEPLVDLYSTWPLLPEDLYGSCAGSSCNTSVVMTEHTSLDLPSYMYVHVQCTCT